MSRIETMEELRQEIRDLKWKQKQKEESLKVQVEQLRKQFRPVIQTFRFLGKSRSGWDRIKSWLQPEKPLEVRLADGKGKRGFKEQAGNFFLNKGVQYALPYFLNRILFRSKLKAGVISILEVALTEGAKSAFKHPKTTFQKARNAAGNTGNVVKRFYRKIAGRNGKQGS